MRRLQDAQKRDQIRFLLRRQIKLLDPDEKNFPPPLHLRGVSESAPVWRYAAIPKCPSGKGFDDPARVIICRLPPWLKNLSTAQILLRLLRVKAAS